MTFSVILNRTMNTSYYAPQRSTSRVYFLEVSWISLKACKDLSLNS